MALWAVRSWIWAVTFMMFRPLCRLELPAPRPASAVATAGGPKRLPRSCTAPSGPPWQQCHCPGHGGGREVSLGAVVEHLQVFAGPKQLSHFCQGEIVRVLRVVELPVRLALDDSGHAAEIMGHGRMESIGV